LAAAVERVVEPALTLEALTATACLFLWVRGGTRLGTNIVARAGKRIELVPTVVDAVDEESERTASSVSERIARDLTDSFRILLERPEAFLALRIAETPLGRQLERFEHPRKLAPRFLVVVLVERFLQIGLLTYLRMDVAVGHPEAFATVIGIKPDSDDH
jgi:hypothetical protein